ncbi:fatty acid desaturase [Vibrio sp. 10N.247.310.17]|uniref:fatty acid desaturase family protein n=1 Tax=Vibrio sp. 10N.247.310.17 TaxID=3229979 RepID=UPI00354CE5E9
MLKLPDQIRAETRHISGYRTLIQLSVIAGSVVCLWAFVLRFNSILGFITASLFTGFALSGLINAAHECTHNTHYRNKWLNQFAGTIMCLPLLLNYHLYRWKHLDHHRYVGTSRDTEIPRHFNSRRDYIATMLGLGYWKYILSSLFQCLLRDFPTSINTRRKQNAVMLNAGLLLLVMLSLVIITFTWPLEILLGYWLPMITAIVLINIFSLAEHYRISPESLAVAESRTVLSNSVVRYFIWNANFHTEHHYFPKIQSYHLPHIYTQTAKQGYEQWSSYLSFHFWVWSELKRKERKV